MSTCTSCDHSLGERRVSKRKVPRWLSPGASLIVERPGKLGPGRFACREHAEVSLQWAMGSEHVLREQFVTLILALSQALRATGRSDKTPDTGLVGSLVVCQLGQACGHLLNRQMAWWFSLLSAHLRVRFGWETGFLAPLVSKAVLGLCQLITKH